MTHTPRHRHSILAAALACGLAVTGNAAAADRDTLGEEAGEAYIHGQLWATYATNPSLEARDIDVDVDGDTVTLTGVVETFGEKALAGVIARSLDGVDEVDNRLRVDPELVVVTVTPSRAFAQNVQDATVAANVDAMLLWNQYTDGFDIDVTADGGVVTLTGTADTEGARNRATQIALGVDGVDTVVNRMDVDPDAMVADNDVDPVDDEWIEDTLQHVYLFSTAVNSGTIDAEASKGDVTLAGTVDSALEREVAIQLAQDLRGVQRVDASDLRVR